MFGTFDTLHPGHLFFLKNAKLMGDELFVVVGRDETVKQVKGAFPEKNEAERMENLKRLPFVSGVMLGDDRDMYKVIETVNPDLICLGYDQNSFTDNLEYELIKRKIDAETLRLEPYKADIYKSSILNRGNRVSMR